MSVTFCNSIKIQDIFRRNVHIPGMATVYYTRLIRVYKKHQRDCSRGNRRKICLLSHRLFQESITPFMATG